jgi:hypothetical protein
LRKHYGLGVAAATGSLRSRDPMDLGELFEVMWDLHVTDLAVWNDSPNFDAKAYYEHLITAATLPELLKEENDPVHGTLAVVLSNVIY